MAVKGQRSVWLAVEQGGETQQGEEKIANHSRVKAMIHSTGPIKEAEVSLGGKGGVVFLEPSGVRHGCVFSLWWGISASPPEGPPPQPHLLIFL